MAAPQRARNVNGLSLLAVSAARLHCSHSCLCDDEVVCWWKEGQPRSQPSGFHCPSFLSAVGNRTTLVVKLPAPLLYSWPLFLLISVLPREGRPPVLSMSVCEVGNIHSGTLSWEMSEQDSLISELESSNKTSFVDKNHTEQAYCPRFPRT